MPVEIKPVEKKIMWGDKAVVTVHGAYYILRARLNDTWDLLDLKGARCASKLTAHIDKHFTDGAWSLVSPGYLKEKEEVVLPSVEIKPMNALHVAYLQEGIATAVISQPTGNCEMVSIAYFDHLNPDKEKRSLELKALLSNAAHPLALIDVNKGLIQLVRDHFPTILVQQEYVNPNGSKMCLFVVKTDVIK